MFLYNTFMEIEKLQSLVDSNGHLLDPSIWNQEIAYRLALQDGIKLTESHLEIIDIVQNIFNETHDTPPMRLLVKQIQMVLGKEKGNSRYLYRLFPNGPVRYACKYAGLPKPRHCL